LFEKYKKYCKTQKSPNLGKIGIILVMRLNKFLAENTGLSRREADELIVAGKVKIDGATAVLGQPVSGAEQILLNGRPVAKTAGATTIMLNKPVGCLSSRRSQGGDPTVYDLLPPEYRKLKTAGRLDKDSSGLMILSSDGDLIQALTHPRYQKTKIYEIELDKPLQPLHQQMIADFGVDLPDGKSQMMLEQIPAPSQRTLGGHKCSASPSAVWHARSPLSQSHDLPPQQEKSAKSKEISKHFLRSSTPREGQWSQPSGRVPTRVQPAGPGYGDAARLGSLDRTGDLEKSFRNFGRRYWQVTMREGRNRQIRRTFAALGYTVTKLHRIQLGPYHLEKLPTGKWQNVVK
jgi:23S rRNA pseudouridine2605 synthase